jgi:hypothetical protein
MTFRGTSLDLGAQGENYIYGETPSETPLSAEVGAWGKKFYPRLSTPERFFL